MVTKKIGRYFAQTDVKRGVIVSFTVMLFFTVLIQSLLPQNNQNKAYAGSTSVTWTTNTDFSAAVNDGLGGVFGDNSASENANGSEQIVAKGSGTGADGALVVDGTTAGSSSINGATINDTGNKMGYGTNYTGPFNSTHPLILDVYMANYLSKVTNAYNFSTITIRNSAVLTHSLGSTAGGVEGLTMNALGNITIDSTSSINLDGKSNLRPSNTYCSSGYVGGYGGSYGTQGGNFNAMAPYGTAAGVEYMGGMGGKDAYNCADGALAGGRIALLGATVTIQGKVYANGYGGTSTSASGGGGAGSGGGIYIKANNLVLTGSLSAAGGGGGGNVNTSPVNGATGGSSGPGIGGMGGYQSGQSSGGSGGAVGLAGNGASAPTTGPSNGNPGGNSAGGSGSHTSSGSFNGTPSGGGGGAGRIALVAYIINSSYTSGSSYMAAPGDASNVGPWPYVVQFTPTIYNTSTLFGGLGTTMGLRNDICSGTTCGAMAKWASISALLDGNVGSAGQQALTSTQSVKFLLKISNDGTTWIVYGRDGSVVNDLPTAFSNASVFWGQVGTGGFNGSIPTSVPASRYVDVISQLSTTDGLTTPALDAVTMSYDTLEAPSNANITMYKSDTSTQLKDSAGNVISGGIGSGWTSDQGLVIKATNITCGTVAGSNRCAANTSKGRKPEVEIKPVGSSFATSPVTGVDTIVGTSDNAGVDQELESGSVTIPASALGTIGGSGYHFRVRIQDESNRVSAWTNYASDGLAFTIEQTSPTISSFAVTSNSGSSSYVNGTSGDRILKFSGIFADLGGSSPNGTGALKVQYSQDGTNWGVINSTNDGNLTTTDWTNYTTITANAGSQNLVNGTNNIKTWYLSGADGSGKQLYVRIMDMAGNVSGKVFTSQSDWTSGTTLSNIEGATTSGDLKILASEKGVAQTSGTANALNRVFFIDANTGWAVGASGTILNTTNGGTNWNLQTSGTTNPLGGVCFTDANNGFAIATNVTTNNLLKTTNGGANWTISNGPAVAPVGLACVNSSTLFVMAYNTIYRSTDGGTSWSSVNSFSNSSGMRIFFPSAQYGYAASKSGGGIPYAFYSTNSGATWTLGYNGFGDGFDVHFSTNTSGLTSTYGGVAYTGNGTSWTRVSAPVSNVNYNGVFSKDANTGYSVGDGGNIIKTTNGGSSWFALTSPTTQQLNHVWSTGGSTYIVGGAGTILKLAPTYPAMGTLGETGTSLVYDSGSTNIQKWSALSWKSEQLTSGQNVKFMVSTDATNWKGPSGSAGDWTTNYFGQTYGGSSFTTIPSGMATSRYLYVKIKLEETSTNDTPTLHDLSIQSATLASNTLTLDTSAPTGTININNSATYATDKAVTLYLNPSDAAPSSGLQDFQLSNDGVNWGTSYNPTSGVYSGTWQAWSESYRPGGSNPGFNWNLIKGQSDSGSDGSRIVYIKYRDSALNIGGDIPATVTIGTQTWLKNNLNVGTMINSGTSQTNNSVLEKYCYGDDPANCVTYGGLYQWNEMMQYSTSPGIQGICPTGFHLPTDAEYKTLEMYLGMSQTQADSYGASRGTNQGTQLKVGGSSGFDASNSSGAYWGTGYNAFYNGLGWYWTSSQHAQLGASFAENRGFSSGPYSLRYNNALNDKTFAESVRCIAGGGQLGISASVTLDTAGPTIANNQAGDTSWRNSNNGVYDVDFADNGSGLANYQIKATAAPSQGGTLLQDWYSVDLASQSSPYTTNWGLPTSVWSNLQEGTNYISIKSLDKAGLSTTLTDAFYVKKDTQAPSVSLSYGSGILSTTSIPLTISDSDAQSGVNTRQLQYQEVALTGGNADFTGAPWTVAASATSPFTGLTAKAYKFRYSATDIANNSSGYSVPNNWIGVDTTAPLASISYQSGLQNTTTIALTKSSQDTQSGIIDQDIEYMVTDLNLGTADFTGKTWQEVGGFDGGDASVNTFNGQSGKAYLFRYRAENGANTWGSGSTEPGVAETYSMPAYWVGVDTNLPSGSLTVNEGKSNRINTTNIHLNLQLADTGGSGLTSYELSTDNSTWCSQASISTNSFINNSLSFDLNSSSCGSVSNMNDGDSRTVYTKVFDGVNNSTTIPLTLVYDTTLPAAVVLTGPTNNQWQQSSTLNFTWLASLSADVDRYEVYIDSQPPITATGTSSSITLTEQNWHSWYVRTYDLAQNYTDSATYHIGNDSLAPSTVLDPGFNQSNFSVSRTTNGKVVISWPNYADDSGKGSPVSGYTIERIKYAFADQANLKTQVWSTLPADAQYYSQTVGSNVTSIEQIAKDSNNSSDTNDITKVDDSVRYEYRIKVTDQAINVSNYLMADYGMSYDTKPPTDPSSVGATACDGTTGTCATTDSFGNTNTKGFAIKLTWNAGVDTGVGTKGFIIYRRAETYSSTASDFQIVGYYPLPSLGSLENPTYYDNDAANLARFTDTHLVDGNLEQIKQTASDKLNDYTNYYYRITSVDANGNESLVITLSDPASPPQTVTDVNSSAAQTPDVTSPIASVLTVNPVGLDNQGDNPKQEIDISWTPAVDARATNRLPEGFGKGIQKYMLYFAPGTNNYNSGYNSLSWTVLDGNVSPSQINTPFFHAQLDDVTYYYYKVAAYDFDNAPTFSDVYYAQTGSSKLPNAPNGNYVSVQSVKGNSVTNTDVGKKVNISFLGGQYLDSGNKVTGYDVYRSTTNYQTNTEWLNSGTIVKQYTGLNVPNNTIDPGESNCPTVVPAGLVDPIHTRCFVDTVPADATTYYYRIRAKGYSQTFFDTTGNGNVFSSNLSGVGSTAAIGKGWDTVPDGRAPELPSGLKVKDIHDDGLNYKRNIVTWARITTPTRNGVNDFKEYKIYRSTDGLTWQQICQSGVNSTLQASCTTQYPNPLYNPNKDIALATNYYMDLIPVSQANRYYYYYVTASDDADVALNYFAPNDNTPVNAYANESKPPKNQNGTISAVSLNPAIAYPSILAQPDNLKASITSLGVSTATVSWTTDQPCDAMVRFRRANSDDNYREIGEGASSLNIGMVSDHTVNLFGLLPNTTYEYQIISNNSLGNPSIAGGNDLPSLTTSGFTVTFGSVSTTTSVADISWTTNLDASSAFIEYQLNKQPGDDPQGGTAGVEPTALAQSPRSHRVVIKGLRSNRTYTYKIKSISTDGFIAETSFLTFKTRNFDSAQFTIAPNSSNVAERNINATTAQIIWETSVPATSWVDYSTKSGLYDVSSGNNDLVTQHVVKLEGLVPGTRYYYRVRVKDANEVEYTSAEASFVAVLKPKISNFKVVKVAPYETTISWETNVDTETTINWGKTASYGEKKGTSGTAKAHVIDITGLEDNTEYHMQIVAHDEAGNEVADEDRIIRTPLDTNGPTITGVKTDILPIGSDESSASVIVSWQTDKGGTTLVEYDEGIIGGHYGQQSIEDKSLNTSHTVIIKDLKPAASYHFKIVSKDKRGNVGQSPDHTFVTPTKEKSILQLILKSLEDTFSWTANVGKFFTNVSMRVTGK